MDSARLLAAVTPNSLSIRDTVVDIPLTNIETTANMHVRYLAGLTQHCT
jgi:hypothetical protein